MIKIGILASSGGFVVPPILQSAALWLDAADLSTITESGGAVSQWDNKGTLGNFSQATAALQPATGTTTLNGLNVVDFAADYLTATNTNEWKFLHDGTSYCCAFVVKPGTTADPNAFYSVIGTNGVARNNGVVIFYDDRAPSRNDSWSAWLTRGTVDPQVINVNDDDLVDANAFNIVTALFDPDNATAAARYEVFHNDGTGLANNTVSSAPNNVNPTFAAQIGAGGNAVLPFTGSIAEIVILRGTDSTESNRLVVRNYLNSKWGVY